MQMTDQQARALVFLACTTRPHGARRWDEAGCYANVAKLRERGFGAAEIIDRTLKHAWDRNAQTPGVLGSQAPSIEIEHTKRGVPRKDQECPRHGGWWADNCGGCRADQLAEGRRREESSDHLSADEALAAIRQTLAGRQLCRHGLDRDRATCRQCEQPQPEADQHKETENS